MGNAKTVRLGCGAGFSSDRLEPAVDLVREGRLDAIIFECVGERTLAFGHRDRRADPSRGYNPLLERRMRAVLAPAREHGTKIITNMGVANPKGAAEKTIEVARALGLKGLKVAALEGDDVTALLDPETELPEAGMRLKDVGRALVGANAYLGAEAMQPALAAGADVLIAGRVADPSLFLAPLAEAFGWRPDDWPTLGAGTLVGHLLECSAQLTGGFFADPGYKQVKNLAYVGFPLAEVSADGSAVVSKLPNAGGMVSERTVKEQLLYEVHNPAAYITPDVVADFSTVWIADQGNDRVGISGAGGRKRPDKLKVTVGFDGGLLAEAGISYAGPGAIERGRLAGEIIRERLLHLHGSNAPLRIDLIGVSSLHGSALEYASDARDVRLRCALRASGREEAELLLWEVEALLCCGPAGGGGYRGQITPSIITHNAFIERERVKTKLSYYEA